MSEYRPQQQMGNFSYNPPSFIFTLAGFGHLFFWFGGFSWLLLLDAKARVILWLPWLLLAYSNFTPDPLYTVYLVF